LLALNCNPIRSNAIDVFISKKSRMQKEHCVNFYETF
jgi:hypothetical protein